VVGGRIGPKSACTKSYMEKWTNYLWEGMQSAQYAAVSSAASRAAPASATLPLPGLRPGPRLIALVKPMFELHEAVLPSHKRRREALARATDAVVAAGWQIVDTVLSPTPGARGALERFVYARRRR